jgi:hypothetical protein
MIVNTEWERMWKEVIVAYFKADCRCLQAPSEEPRGTLFTVARVPFEIRTEGVSEALPLERTRPGP